MKKWLACVGLIMAMAQPSSSWQPSGWVYFNWPYAYDHASQDWHWFSPNNVKWVNRLNSGEGWRRLNQSTLAHGWSWHLWPYAYGHAQTSWYNFAAAGSHKCVNLRTGQWSVFGVPPAAPSELVTIPGGTNSGTDPDFGDYTLTVSTFRMGRYLVTKALWDEVHAWAVTHGYSFENAGSGRAADHPVQMVDWYDVLKWCNARSEKEGLTPAYYTSAIFTAGSVYRTGKVIVQDAWVNWEAGYRLASVTEWTYAARGGLVGKRFPWGDTIDHTRANYMANGSAFAYDTTSYTTDTYHPDYDDTYPHTSPVNAFAPNGYGLYDMIGNVYEWNFNKKNTWSAEDLRVYRGGAWGFGAEWARNAVLLHFSVDYEFNYLGFRVVLPMDQ